MAEKIAIAKRVAFQIAAVRGRQTIGDICDALRLHSGTDSGRRLREARQRYGFAFKHETERVNGKTWHVYAMDEDERARIKALPEFQRWKRSRA